MTPKYLKDIVRRTFLYDLVRRWRYGNMYYSLANSGNLVPPSYDVKRLTILLYARLFQIGTFLETGTYLGDTVDAVKHEFDEIYSIELDPLLYDTCRKRFSALSHIHIIHADSGKILPEVLDQLTTPCLFWLDGHYSSGNTAHGEKNTPILEELTHILHRPIRDHVILIDDARCYSGYGDYPTLSQIQQLILRNRPDYFFDVRYDMIRAHRILSPAG